MAKKIEVSNKTIKLNFYYYPYRELQWECTVSDGSNTYVDSNNPAIAATKDEAKELAIEIFKKTFFIYSEEKESITL